MEGGERQSSDAVLGLADGQEDPRADIVLGAGRVNSASFLSAILERASSY